MPFGQRRQICCEQIEITAPDAALADLPALMLPLAAPDLPLIVWCRSARLARMPEFSHIAGMARKVILDSQQLAQPPGDHRSALGRLEEAVRNGVIVGDLAWARLTRWREMLAQVFENRKYLELLPGVTDAQISYPAGQKILALYFGAWLQSSLHESTGARVRFAAVPGEAFRVDLRGEGLHLEQVRSGGRIVVTMNGLSQCTNLPDPIDYLTLREELGILRRDPVFENALAWAAGFAYPDQP
jgi:glucose-6-phosphate dehydrogenase assembly protein OpcA